MGRDPTRCLVLMQTMRIAYVTAHYAPFVGGVESHVIQIAKRVAKEHGVVVLTHQERPPLPSEELIDGVRVLRFRVPVASRNYAISPGLVGHLRSHTGRCDVVHAHGYHALPALFAALTKRAPLVFTPHYHGTGHSPFRTLLHPPYRRVGRIIFDRADRTIAVSEPEAELILRHFPDVRRKLVVIPNGVDEQALDAALPFETNRNVLLSAGRIEAYKQVDKTVAAVAHLPDDFVLRVTGDGPARAAVERIAAQLGVGDRVEFLGKVSEDQLYRWFRTASIYISMSSNEAMPVTLIECLAAGARVVASDIPAHRALMKKTGGTIALVPLDAEPAAVARAIVELAEQPVVPARVDTWDDVTNRTISLYQNMISA